MVDKFIATLIANAKTYQIDTILRQRLPTEKAKEQRVAAATKESDDNVCLNESEHEEASTEADTHVFNTRSRVGYSPRLVTQEALMTMLDISGTGAMLTPKHTGSRKFPAKSFSPIWPMLS